MWPYACLSDCKVMVKCVESDGKVIVTHVSVQSHHQPVRPDIERVAVTHHVSHACDTAKVPVGSMHCPCTANGCCSRVPIVMAHACAVPCDWIAMQPSIAMQHSWSFIRVMHMPPHHRGFICSLGHSLKRLLMPPHHRGFIRSLGFHWIFGSFIEESFDGFHFLFRRQIERVEHRRQIERLEHSGFICLPITGVSFALWVIH